MAKLSLTNTRLLKIYPRYFQRSSYNYPAIFPEIRLSGKWLEDSGFECGEMVMVSHENKKIVITIAQSDGEKNG